MMIKKIQQFQKIQKCNEGWQMANYLVSTKKLGAVTDGQVFLGENLTTKESVAIKIIPFENFDEKKIELLTTLQSLNCPFIAKFHEVYEVEDSKAYYLIFHLYNGSLEDYLKDYDKKNELPPGGDFQGLSESEALAIFCQIVEGCLAMWNKEIVHQNIKPANVLYSFDKMLDGNVFVLADFGLAKNQVASMKTQGDTIAYMAPETINGKNCDYRVDVWSLGVLLHEMLFGPLHIGKGKGTIMIDPPEYKYILSKEHASKISHLTAILLNDMIIYDPDKRLAKEDLKNRIKNLKEYAFTGQVKGKVINFNCPSNMEEAMNKLSLISNDVKPNDKIFLNFNRYKIEYQYSEKSGWKNFQDIPYDKNAMRKVVEMVVELSAKVQELNFDYSNDELEAEECKQLAQLQKQHPQNVYSYYSKTIQATFSSGNFSNDLNQLNTQLTQLTPNHLAYLHLYAQESGFGNDEAQKIANTLNSIQNLSKLHLSLGGYSNKIQAEGAIQIAHALQNLHLLSNLFLSFSFNKIQIEGAKQISAALQKNTKISSLELDFADTAIGNDGAQDIAQALKMLPNVTNLVLNAQVNNLNDTGATAIAKALTTFAHSPTFTLNLYLSQNQIGDAGATEIASALKALKGLSHLNLQLQYNEIGNVGAIEIASALKSLNNLSYLYLGLRPNEYTEEAKKHFEGLKVDEIYIQKV